MSKICIAGATGRMGSTVISEICKQGEFKLIGAIADAKDEKIGRSIKTLGICNLDVKIEGPENIIKAVKQADVYLSFTTPDAEMVNLPIVAKLGKRIVMGTTGFSEDQLSTLRTEVGKRVPAVFAPNFSVGVNVLFKLLESLKHIPKEYDFSVVELHHRGKKDAPSGTAARIANIISEYKNYDKIIFGRSGMSLRQNDELEVASIRAGGIPGTHEVLVAGAHEMLKIQHISFSRSVFAQGALYAAKWILNQEKAGIYSMEDVLI